MPRTGRAMKLGEADVKQLVADWRAGVDSRGLAVKYGVNRNTVYTYLTLGGARDVRSRVVLDRAEVTRLLAQHSQTQAAKILGVSAKVLKDYRIRWGLLAKRVAARTEKRARRATAGCYRCGAELLAGRYRLVMVRRDFVRVCDPCAISLDT